MLTASDKILTYSTKLLYDKTTCPHCGKDIYVRYQREPQVRILGLVDSDGVATNSSSNPDIDAIYNFWNDQHIIVHRNLTSDIARAIRAELKNYSETEILQAIKNYAEIQKGDQYWFKYIWTLRDFLKRGVAKFLDWEVAKRNYLKQEITPIRKVDPDKYIKGKYGHMVRR